RLRSLHEKLGEVRRAMCTVEPAAQAVAREERPVDQGLVGFDAAYGAEIRVAAAELDLEMLDEGRPVVDDRDQQLTVNLRDVELARVALLREETHDHLVDRLVGDEGIDLVEDARVTISRTEGILERTRAHFGQRADEVRFEDVLLDRRRVVQRRVQCDQAVLRRREVADDRKARLTACDARLKAAAGRIALLTPVEAEIRRADDRAPGLELAASALPDDIVRHTGRDAGVPEVVAARQLAFETERELERHRLVVAAARPAEIAPQEV